MQIIAHCTRPWGMKTQRNYLPFKGNRNDTRIHKIISSKMLLEVYFSGHNADSIDYLLCEA
jgi:hypothetical protein